MAHFAQINDEYVVIMVIVVSNEVIDNLPFPESEPLGVEFCKSLYGLDTKWAQTSYNANFRYNYAGEGYSFDQTAQPNGAFIPPKPFSSWLLNTNTYQWQAPVPYPDDGQFYYWDEAIQQWVLAPQPALANRQS